MKNRAIASVAAALLVTGIVSAQGVNLDSPAKPKAYVLYAAEPQTIPAGKSAMLELRFHMVPGYHVNSHTPKFWNC